MPKQKGDITIADRRQMTGLWEVYLGRWTPRNPDEPFFSRMIAAGYMKRDGKTMDWTEKARIAMTAAKIAKKRGG